MRELFPVDSESTETSLVLRTEDGESFSSPSPMSCARPCRASR